MKKTSKENIEISEIIGNALGLTFKNEELSLGNWGEVDNWSKLSDCALILVECEKGQKHPNTNILKLYPYLEENTDLEIILIHYFYPENKAPKNRLALCDYLGDGETDIPCMKLIKEQGGHSIAVYKPRDSKKKKVSEKLINENRVNFACSADYTVDSEIFQVVKTILEKIKADFDFQTLLNQHQKKANPKVEEIQNSNDNDTYLSKDEKKLK